MNRYLSIAAVLLLMSIVARAQQPPDFGVHTHVLKNGMKILIQEDHSIPSVALYIFYRIGSRNERPGTTGLSHFFEHMMFNGAEKYFPKDRLVFVLIGRANEIEAAARRYAPRVDHRSITEEGFSAGREPASRVL